MKKYNKLVLASIALMSLSACKSTANPVLGLLSNKRSFSVNGAEEIREVIYNDNKVYEVENIVLPHQEINLIKGSKFQLYPRITPAQASTNTLKFESETKTIASVDKAGLITARGEGKTIITVSSENGVKTEVPVNVVLSNKNATIAAAQATQEAQTDMAEASKMSMLEYSRRETYVEGQLAKSEYELDNFLIDADNAYFAIEGYDVETKTINGAASVLDYAWYVYTTANYETFLFHKSGNKKNYLKVDNSSFISQGKTRLDALYDVLDHLFTSGSAIMTNQLEYVLNKADLQNDIIDILSHDYNNASGKGGVFAETDHDFYSEISITFSNQTVEKDEESDMELYAGTKYDADMKLRFAFQENLCTLYCVDQTMTYVNEGNNEARKTYIERHISPEVELVYPSRTEYTQVDSIFDV